MDKIVSTPWAEILQWHDKDGHFHEAPLEDVLYYGRTMFEEDDRIACQFDGYITLAGLCESRRYNRWWLRDQEIL